MGLLNHQQQGEAQQDVDTDYATSDVMSRDVPCTQTSLNQNAEFAQEVGIHI